MSRVLALAKSVRPRAWALLAVILLVAMFVACPIGRGGTKRSDPAVLANNARFDAGMPEAVAYRNLVEGYGQRVGHNERALTDLSKKMDALAQLAEAAGLQAQSRIDGLERTLSERSLRGAVGGFGDNGLRKVSFGAAKPAGKSKTLHLPAGSFGEATLLTGVFAPVNGDAMPVLIKLDAVLVGPNKTRVPVSGAFVIGKAVGDANSRRVVVQLDTLSLVLPSSEAHDYKVNGFVVDKDGTQGIDGIYVWRAEEILALAGVSGGASGLANLLGASETTPLGGIASALTGDAGKHIVAQGTASGLAKISDIIAERLKEIQAAIYVPNAKKITISFLSGVTLEGYGMKELSDDSSQHPYRGLDHDR